jgi:hypothetical protein
VVGEPAAPGTPAAAGTPTPATSVTTAAEAPCTGATTLIRSGGTELEVSDCGAVRGIRFADVASRKEVTGWWAWAWGRVSGDLTGPWRPYVGGDTALELVPDGEFLVAGRGPAALGATWTLVSAEPLVQRRTTNDGLTITRTLAPGKDGVWSASIRFEGDRPLLGPFWVGVAAAPVKDATEVSSKVPLVLASVDGDVETLLETTFPKPVPLEGPVSWFGVGDQYHLAAAAPESPEGGTIAWQQFSRDRVGALYTLGAENLAPATPIEAKFVLYTGVRELRALEAAGHGLDSAASLGFFGLFAKFMLVTLHLLHGAVGEWGWAILALTLLVRVVTYPLTRSALISGRKMQALQPLIKELQEKHGDDKETLSRWRSSPSTGSIPSAAACRCSCKCRSSSRSSRPSATSRASSMPSSSTSRTSAPRTPTGSFPRSSWPACSPSSRSPRSPGWTRRRRACSSSCRSSSAC